MTTTKEQAKLIRAKIKEMKFNRYDFRVRISHGGLSSSININLQNMELLNDSRIDELEDFCEGFSNVSYCQASGETLGGCNTYIFFYRNK